MMRDNNTLAEIRKLVKTLFANIQASVYLYGSRARGDARNDSDWDILIITDDAVDKKTCFEKFAYPFTEIGWLLGEQITPLLYTRAEWKAQQNTAFYHNVQSDSIKL